MNNKKEFTEDDMLKLFLKVNQDKFKTKRAKQKESYQITAKEFINQLKPIKEDEE